MGEEELESEDDRAINSDDETELDLEVLEMADLAMAEEMQPDEPVAGPSQAPVTFPTQDEHSFTLVFDNVDKKVCKMVFWCW